MEQQHTISKLVTEIEHYLRAFELASMTEVRAGIARWSNAAVHPVEPATLGPCTHLAAALASMQHRNLAHAMETALPLLRWAPYDSYPRAEIGAAFADGHAFAPLIGENGFYRSDDFDFGLFIIAPKTLYPDHRHAAPELYAPLTGPHGWRFLPDQKYHWINADIPIWNEPWAAHATLTGEMPFLCIYCWTKNVNIPAKVILQHKSESEQR